MSLRVNIIPPFKCEGWFELSPPFKLVSGKVYICEEIRSFEELARLGKKPLEEVYLKNGLTKEHYEEDKKLEASIVTLKPIGGQAVYVPSTYIISYPGMKGTGYTTKVLVMEVGLLPRNLNMSSLNTELADYIKKSIGVDALISEASHIYDGLLSPEDQVKLEKARRLAIENYVSKDQQIERATEQVTQLIDNNTKLAETVLAQAEYIRDLEAQLGLEPTVPEPETPAEP